MNQTTRKRKTRHPRCGVCKQRLDSPKHRKLTESACFNKNLKAIRSRARPKVTTVSALYKEGRLRSEFQITDVEDKLIRRQADLAQRALVELRNGYQPPRNITWILDQGFVWTQIANEHPWAVMWIKKDGSRGRKRFNNLYAAIAWHRRAVKKNHTARIVSRGRAYDIPRDLRLKKDRLPKKFKWCPFCADFRVYRKVYPLEQFYAMVKVRGIDKKGDPKWEWKERKLWLTECQLCGNTNRNPVYRRSNQPWNLIVVKAGKRRTKKGLKHKPEISRKHKRANARRRRG